MGVWWVPWIWCPSFLLLRDQVLSPVPRATLLVAQKAARQTDGSARCAVHVPQGEDSKEGGTPPEMLDLEPDNIMWVNQHMEFGARGCGPSATGITIHDPVRCCPSYPSTLHLPRQLISRLLSLYPHPATRSDTVLQEESSGPQRVTTLALTLGQPPKGLEDVLDLGGRWDQGWGLRSRATGRGREGTGVTRPAAEQPAAHGPPAHPAPGETCTPPSPRAWRSGTQS